WEMIGQNQTLQLKLFFGTLSLMAAYANHFFFRYLKRSLVSSGRNPSLLQGVNLITAVFDKVALVCGVIAALSGVGLNHL
ncbi:MAG: hypothetical protein ACE5FU_05130, partial [Nitrospinota bacterium]